MVGWLQSMVPAMPGNIGATYLHQLYDSLHADDGSGLLPNHPTYFYRPATLTEAAFSEIDWWKEYLSTTACAISRPPGLMVLATTWGGC
eukprot:6356435-Ditylum_brightwellii.AAC.1